MFPLSLSNKISNNATGEFKLGAGRRTTQDIYNQSKQQLQGSSSLELDAEQHRTYITSQSNRTTILHHRAEKLGLNIRPDGYVPIDQLLQLKVKTFAGISLCSHTIDDVQEAVKNDNKQRFSLHEENGQLYIRANQGHTVMVVESDELLTPISSAEEVPVCVHGTYRKSLEPIFKTSLSRMKRHRLHFATRLPHDNDVVSGMRGNVEILIYLDVEKALKDGMKLYLSDNKVLLTEGFNGVVPPKYFGKVAT